jgi:TolB protein
MLRKVTAAASVTGAAQRKTRRRLIVGGVTIAVAAAATAAVALSGPGSHPRGLTASHHHVTAAKRAAVAAASTLAAPAAPSPPALLTAGQQGTRQDVPWSQVGPGWILATRSPVRPGGATTVFLIDPAGGRYSLDTLPAEAANSPEPDHLVAWSGDGERALLDSDLYSSHVAVLNLRTGTAAQLSLGSGVSPLGFTTPDGLAILAEASTDPARPHLERFSLSGALEQAYPASFSGGGYYNGISAVYSPDGTELAVSTSAAMELMSNDGQVIRALSVGPSATNCAPVRWWTTTELLASCDPPGAGIAQLWLVPVSGAPATSLTASPAARGDEGDLDAWPLPAGTYVQDAGACGYVYLARLQANRQTAPVTVPGVPQGDSVIVAGSYADELAVTAQPPCGAGASLLRYSPAQGTTTPLLGGTAPGGGSVTAAFLFGEPAGLVP